MGTGTQQQTTVTSSSSTGDLHVEAAQPVCSDCGSEARWAGSPADSGFLAYCPSCDKAFHVTMTAQPGGEIRLS